MKTGNRDKTIRIFLIGILPVLLVWAIVSLIIRTTPVLDIVRANYAMPFSVYTDQELKGHTYASADQTTEGIVFDYELKKGYAFPYAGISFGGDSGIPVIQSNSTFIIELKTTASNKIIPILLNEWINHEGKKIERPVQYELKTVPGQHIYHVPIDAFEVPAWWYKNNDMNKDLSVFNPAHVQNICVQNSLLSALNIKDRIEIIQLSNHPGNSSWIWLAAIFSGCWITGCGIYLLIHKKKQTIFIPYVSTEPEREPSDAWEQIRIYVSTNYMNDIDMERMEKDLGIARHKIALLIKENTTLIFKQYLNQIKVAEAKRLLLETNLPIGEIADKVGFGHLSNFNRVFKQYFGESPSDLRKQVQAK